MYTLLSVITVLVAVSLVPVVLSDSMRGEFTIPNWIKNNAGWWAEGQIDDGSFVSGIQWLISNNIITIDYTGQEIDSEDSIIPNWVKNTAGWWAEDKIHDVAFVGAIKYLIDMGIIIIEQELEEVVEPVEEVMEIKDFYMEINGNSCTHCVNWAYVGKEYKFQIETYDKKTYGKYIDGVKISAKIISNGGELRHDFGEVITEDGIYKNSITIPNMDWYAGNILSVTGEYFGVEKTIEKEFEVFRHKSGGSGVTMTGAGDCALVSPVSLADQNAKPQGLAFSSDGTKLFTTGNPGSADSVWYYELDDAYCIATASFVDALSVESTDNTPTGVGFNPTGTKMFVVGKQNDLVIEYDLSSAFLPSTATKVHSFTVSEDTDPEDIHFNPTGTKMFIVGSQADQVHQYTLSAPFVVSSASHDYTLPITDEESSPAGIHFNPTGTKMFVVGAGDNAVNQYTLSAPFVLSSASHDHAFSINTQENNARAIWFDNTGKKMFIIGFTGDDVNVYKLSTPFVVSSASHVS